MSLDLPLDYTAIGAAVNLERSLLPTDRLGGHLVSGHVDAVGRLEKVWDDGRSQRWRFSAPPAVLLSGGARQRIVAWAGPWPIEQRWWTPERSRRLARFQVVTERGVAHLVAIEQQRWSILATYA